MKKIIYLTMTLACHVAVCAQTEVKGPALASNNINVMETDLLDIPESATSRFTSDYPAEIADWYIIDDNYYKACYTDSKTRLERAIVYDKNGQVIREENELDYTYVPYSLINYYSTNSKKEDFHVWETQTEKGDKVYVSKMNGKIDYFDKDAKYLPMKPQIKQDDSKTANR
jgi:hypothetical protein